MKMQIMIDGVQRDATPAEEMEILALQAKAQATVDTVKVPETISDRQFFAVLEKMGRITYDEALQAVKTGDLPPAFEAFLASLDEDKQKSYRLFMEGETFFSRNHQITLDLAAFFKMTDQQVDAIFIEGDKL